MELNNINNKGAWSEIAAALNQNFLKILAELLKYQHVTTISGANFLGYFTSSSVLPNSAEAAWAVAGDLKAVTVYAYYTSDAVPNGFSAGWNALSSLGTYDFTDYSELLTKVEETDAKVSELGSKIGYNVGNISLKNGAYNITIGEFLTDKDVNNRIKTSIVKTPCKIEVDAPYRIRTVIYLDSDKQVVKSFGVLSNSYETTYNEPYVTFLLDKNEGNDNLNISEDIQIRFESYKDYEYKELIQESSGLTNDEEFNSMITELVLPNDIDISDIDKIIISDCYLYQDTTYYNTVRYHRISTNKNYNIYSKAFNSLEDAQADIGTKGKIVGGENGYAVFRSIGLGKQKTYSNLTFTRPLTLNYNPAISSYINSENIKDIEEEIAVLRDNIGVVFKKIKMLCFGNSFTQDSMGYVPFILQKIAPELDLTIGIAYIGGCPLVQHCVNLTGVSMALNDTQYDLMDYTFQVYKTDNGKWSTEGSMSADTILAYDRWDIITFQQNGTASDADWVTYYEPYIFKIHKAIAEKVLKPIKLGWLSVHGAYKSTFDGLLEKWQGTIENTQKIQSLTGNQIVFPYGTAVQNLRTTPLVNLGDGGFLLGDNAHLHDGIGCLAAAYANALKILEVSGYDIHSIIGDKTRPTKEWITEKGIPAPNYGAVTNDVVGITEDNCYTAQISAIMAVKKPYEVTDCNAFYEG